jgi:MFS transporter, OFA family, oxalate/formate antiporter
MTAAHWRTTTILVVALLTMGSLGSLYAWSVLIEPIEHEIGASRTASSVVFSAAIVCFTVAMLGAAELQQRATPATILLATTALAATGLALPGMSRSWPALLIGIGILFGLANGLGYSLAIALVQSAFPARRGLFTGLAVASYTAGSAVFAVLLAWSVATVGLWPSFLGWAGLMLALGGPGAWALHRSVAVLILDPGSHRPADSLLHTRLRAALWTAFLCAAFVGVWVLAHAAAIAGWLGARSGEAALTAALVAAANGVGRLGGGWLTDHLEPRWFLTPGLTVAGASLALLWAAPGLVSGLVALGATGLAYGAMVGAYPAIIARLYGVAQASRVYGRVFTAWGVAGLAGPVTGGLLFDCCGGYAAAIPAAAFAAGLAALASWAVVLPRAEPSR